MLPSLLLCILPLARQKDIMAKAMTAMAVILESEEVMRIAAMNKITSIESISSKLKNSAEWKFMQRAVGIR
jgi:hypothetical protein